jgi:hypothetical protein
MVTSVGVLVAARRSATVDGPPRVGQVLALAFPCDGRHGADRRALTRKCQGLHLPRPPWRFAGGRGTERPLACQKRPQAAQESNVTGVTSVDL